MSKTSDKRRTEEKQTQWEIQDWRQKKKSRPAEIVEQNKDER